MIPEDLQAGPRVEDRQSQLFELAVSRQWGATWLQLRTQGRGEWSSCTDCHSNSANYAEFSCLGCHEHSRSEMDGEHDEVGGYSWESQACLQCHPNGQSNDRLPRRQRTIGLDPRPRHPLR